MLFMMVKSKNRFHQNLIMLISFSLRYLGNFKHSENAFIKGNDPQ